MGEPNIDTIFLLRCPLYYVTFFGGLELLVEDLEVLENDEC